MASPSPSPSHISLDGNTRGSSRARELVQFLLLKGNRIYLNARQQLLVKTGFAVAVLAVSYLLLLFNPAPGAISTADLAPVFLLGTLLFTGFALMIFHVVVPAFPRAGQVASRIAYKVNHIFLGGPA